MHLLLSPPSFTGTNLNPEMLSGRKMFISKQVMSHVNHLSIAKREMVNLCIIFHAC